MDHNHSNLQLREQTLPPQAQTLSTSLTVACAEWLNATECANITFAIGKVRIGTVATDGLNTTLPPDNLVEMDLEADWPLERVVSMIVPVFFGIIGFAGLLGNALVILGKCSLYPPPPAKVHRCISNENICTELEENCWEHSRKTA